MQEQMPKDNKPLSGLARKLIQTKLITQEAMMIAIENSTKSKSSLMQYLIHHKLIGAQEMASIAAFEFGLPLLDLNEFALEMVPKTLVSEKLIRQHHAFPLFKRGHCLFVAMSDPNNLSALDDFKFHTGLTTESIIVNETVLALFIDKALSEGDTPLLNPLDDSDLEALDINGIELEEDGMTNETQSEADDAPIVRFVNKVLIDAIHKGASDIHFEPYEKTYRVRLRQDGILYEFAAPPVNLAPRLAARLKVMSKLDISERRIPQDGRFKMKLSRTRSIDFRVSTCPTLFGEKVVMRILDPSTAKMGIDALGYEDFQKKIFLEAIHKPQGMVVVTGPTGSGKTVSLYTALNILNTSEVNISTAEDPVEINLPGVNQVHVNPKAGLTFATALRSFLRQDPDIVMIGEIRDLETAEIAIKASQTGHMVLSTLHTNSAPETLMRMINMGVAAFNLATSLSLVIAQRLARRLCQHCKTPIDIPKEALLEIGFEEAELKDFTPVGPLGCHLCTNGYKGRVGLYEVMQVTPAIGHIIMKGGNALEIAEQMQKDGGITLRRAGLNKIKLGLTSLEEINRVTK